jgi:hypothetical protein
MDFSRSTQPQTAAPAAVGHKKSGGDKSPLGRVAVVVAAALVALLLIALAVVSFGNNSDGESKFVNSDKLQAVFLNTGQVYFGKITDLNSKYFVVTNIYYLQTSSTGTTGTSSANTSVSLVKLGCELHEPYDKMVINRSQVTFWENLQSDGQVAKAVATFQQKNPNGQKCSDQGSSASGSTTNSVQNAGTANTTKP